MSLTNLVREPVIRALFDEYIGDTKKLPKASIKAPPLTENYQKVGTAFDYLLRLHLQRKFPQARSSEWIAEEGLRKLSWGIGFLPDDEKFRENDKRLRLATEYLEDARVYARAFLRTGNLTDDLLAATLRLSDFDAIYRVGSKKMNWETFGHYDSKDVDDLRALYVVAENVNFHADRGCILNPAFNDASKLVGGADADVILDSSIIEIKTTKDLRLDRRDLYQLLGYYLLLRLDGICTSGVVSFSVPCEETTRIMYEETISPILNAAIYFPRYGYMYSHVVEEILPKKNLTAFALRFVELICPGKPRRQKYWREFQGTLANTIRETVPAELTTKLIKTRPRSKVKAARITKGSANSKGLRAVNIRSTKNSKVA